MSKHPQDTIYLLHAENRDGRIHHYVGMTNLNRLDKRLKEHCAGFGAKYTRWLANHCNALSVAKVWVNTDHKQEKRVKAGGNYRGRCPLCSNINGAEPLLTCDTPPFDLQKKEDAQRLIAVGSFQMQIPFPHEKRHLPE